MNKLVRFLTIPVLSVLMLTGQGCGGPSAAEIEAASPVTVTIWRVFDNSSTFGEIMSAYRVIHPNVSFDYREMRYDEYQEELLNAFAHGEGPDIFSIHNTWIGEYEDLIAPLPDSLSIPYTEVKGTIKKETITTVREEPALTLRELRNDFVDIVAEDVIRPYQPDSGQAPQDRIFALPMALDTLVLFYNKDLMNAAGIAEPPASWQDFQDQVKLLTRVDAQGLIIQSGAALGTSDNVERSTDILSVLMMQNGTQMTNDGSNVTFADETGEVAPGEQAVRFYTDFANPVKEVFTWDATQPDSFDAFVDGKTAFFFGYAYHVPLVKSRAPKLNYGVTRLPQIEGGRTVDYANYWVETVAKASPNQKWAWDFIQFATSEEHVMSYLDAAGKPTARRALVNEQIEDEDLFPFVSSVLTAKSWYRGNDATVAEQALRDLIDETLTGIEIPEAIRRAQNKVQQTY